MIKVSYSKRMYQLAVVVFTFLLAYILLMIQTEYHIQNDTFWHLKAGEYMVNHKTILTRDVFSWTVKGEHWYSHEWLWEVIAYTVYSKFGFTGLFIFDFLQVFLILLLGVVLFGNALSCTVFSAGMLMYTTAGYICARPHLTGLLLLILMLVVYYNVRDESTRLVFVFLVFIFWANIHSSAVLGTGAVFLLTLLEGKPEKKKFILPVAAFAGSLINPHFAGIYAYFFKTVFAQDMVKYINEWQSPNFHIKTILFFTLVVITIFVFAIKTSKNTKGIAWFVLGLAAFLTSIRNAALFSLFAALGVRDVILEDIRIEKLLKQFVIFALPVLLVTQIRITLPNEKFFENALANIMPQKAVDFMIEKGFTERVFNEYHYGGYLIWRGIKPSIDSRADLYYFANKKFWDDFINSTLLLNEKPEDVLFKTKARYVLFPSNSGYIKYLKAKGIGKVLYQDREATLLELKGSLN